ncbi:uncharacterized protein B0I36DRAFT_78162 [Microdochium trichocladiopsis]|uniref:Uncharacterized protein n=1 Tax=Microdochium trichocladiopsis TaxID=1682393 RepID=A0A9P9BYS3_9PEZI|nr:uncharacterized protein B0I36DRAFT_78162 [Microdochium trichocladiopsis]KAH7038323.1 hypothetical protein B0I36DRAFT_78162 [Microdochium trichocladiopsis]
MPAGAGSQSIWLTRISRCATTLLLPLKVVVVVVVLLLLMHSYDLLFLRPYALSDWGFHTEAPVPCGRTPLSVRVCKLQAPAGPGAWIVAGPPPPRAAGRQKKGRGAAAAAAARQLLQCGLQSSCSFSSIRLHFFKEEEEEEDEGR